MKSLWVLSLTGRAETMRVEADLHIIYCRISNKTVGSFTTFLLFRLPKNCIHDTRNLCSRARPSARRLYTSPKIIKKLTLRGRLQRTSAKISDFQTTPLPLSGCVRISKNTSLDVRVRIFQFLHIFIFATGAFTLGSICLSNARNCMQDTFARATHSG